MQCPFCKEANADKVIDSRATEGGKVIRRRRHCLKCGKRFTTYERVEEFVRLAVIKKDGTRAPYDRAKIFAGLQRACWKRPIPADALQRLVDEVEDEVFRRFDREVESRMIGLLVAGRLRKLDKVAYLRFASISREFQEVGEFIQEAQAVMDASRDEAPGQQELFNE
jgi:transcriptional repressor NrdR